MTPPPGPRVYGPRVQPQAVQLAVTIIECYAMAEIVWRIILENDEWLYQAALAQLGRVRDAVAYRVQVLDTLRMIRRLPENDT